jgi:beta-xylosidase
VGISDLLLLCDDDQVDVAKTQDDFKIATQLVNKINYNLETSTETTKSMTFCGKHKIKDNYKYE